MSVQLYLGDCIEVLRGLDDNSVDTCITDPPYGLRFMGKEWDTFRQDKRGKNQIINMGNGMKQLNHIELVEFQEWTTQWAQAVYRVLKPGAIMLAFGGTRTYHRMVCAIEDAGFEIRDMVEWIYGSGFPKSLDIGKAIDKQAGAEREVVGMHQNPAGKSQAFVQERSDAAAGCFSGSTKYPDGIPLTKGNSGWDGWGTALKPAHEPIVVAMKPVDGTFANNALTWGVAGMWIDGGRVEYQGDADWDNTFRPSQNVDRNCWLQDGNRMPRRDVIQRSGRFPANLIHDGSDEVLAVFPHSNGAAAPVAKGQKEFGGVIYGKFKTGGDDGASFYNDSGSAARFFYCAKASRSERNAGLEGMPNVDGGHYRQDEWSRTHMGNKPDAEREPVKNNHPTVKPISLMRYLVRLTKTPTGGVVLDPFMGSGTTGCACALEGRDFIGIEREQDYFAIAEKRIAEAQKQPKLELE